jgi:uncharacterized protein (UPF0335 family)
MLSAGGNPEKQLSNDSATSGAQTRPNDFIDRILELKNEADQVNDAIRQVYAEAKNAGLNKTALGMAITYLRKDDMQRNKRAELDSLAAKYLEAYLETQKILPTRAHAHEPIVLEEAQSDVIGNAPATAPTDDDFRTAGFDGKSCPDIPTFLLRPAPDVGRSVDLGPSGSEPAGVDDESPQPVQLPRGPFAGSIDSPTTSSR